MTITKWIVAGGILAAVLAVARKVLGAGRLPMPDCKELSAAHHSGKRDLSRLRLLVIHSTEGSTASGAAGWFANPASGGSTHLVVDDVDCFRTLPDDIQPWGASGGDANPRGLHIECAGFARWSRDEWLTHRGTLEQCAAWLREWSDLYGIPLRELGPDAVKRGEAGVTTHAAISKAYAVSGGHVDPGPGFPLDLVLALARGEG